MLSNDNMAFELVGPCGTRTIAIPTGKTFDECVEWAQQWLGKGEKITNTYQFSFN